MPCQLAAQLAAGLHEQRPVDRLVRQLHVRSAGVGTGQPPGDLLGRPVLGQLVSHDQPQQRIGRQLRGFGRRARTRAACSARSARYARQPPLRLTSRDTVDGSRSSRRAMHRMDSPAARPREISSRSASDNRVGATHRGPGLMPPDLRMSSATDDAANPIARAIIDALAPSAYRCHTSACSASVMNLPTCHSIEEGGSSTQR